MDDGGSAASIILFIVLLLSDMFFYGFGAAITALNEKEVERRADEEKDKKSIKLKRIIGNPAEYVGTVQLITTLMNVVIGAILLRTIRNGLISLAERQMEVEAVTAQVFFAAAAVLATLLILYIILTLGVLLPKKIAARVPEKWAYICINPVYFVTKLLSPFTGLVTVTVKGICGKCGIYDKGVRRRQRRGRGRRDRGRNHSYGERGS